MLLQMLVHKLEGMSVCAMPCRKHHTSITTLSWPNLGQCLPSKSCQCVLACIAMKAFSLKRSCRALLPGNNIMPDGACTICKCCVHMAHPMELRPSGCWYKVPLMKTCRCSINQQYCAEQQDQHAVI